MINSLATEADILLAGYQIGYYSIDDVIAWADRWIAALDEPPMMLLDLSMGRELYDVDFTNLLRSLGSGEGDVAAEIRLGMIGAGVLSGRETLEWAIYQLFRLTMDGNGGLDPEQEGKIYELDDECGLATSGVYGSVEQVEIEARRFLGPYVDRLKLWCPLPSNLT